MLSFMNFKGTVVNQMITPHNETRFLSDQLKKKQSQQKKCDFSATHSTTISARSTIAFLFRPPQDRTADVSVETCCVGSIFEKLWV